eukprot:7388126-Prymnesium_polylepis.1
MREVTPSGGIDSALDGTPPEASVGGSPSLSCSRCTRLSPSEQLQKCARPRIAVERGLDVASEQPPLCGRVGKAAVREALYLDHSERPELIAVRLQHSSGM